MNRVRFRISPPRPFDRAIASSNTAESAPGRRPAPPPRIGSLCPMREFESKTTDGPDPAVPDHLPTAAGDSQLQSQTLESLADAKNYHRWLTDLARPYLGDHPIELGSGLGDYAQQWLDDGVPRITVTEVDPPRLAGLRARFAGDDRVTVTGINVFDPPSADHSAFAAFNVLEHLDNDVEALRAAHRLVRPGGRVIMLVPAFEFAMSRFDREVGHFRRYTVHSLAECMGAAGLRIDRIQYVNMPGLLAWFIGMRLLRMTPGDGPIVRVWDKRVIPVTRRLENRLRAPFGQSVFAVAHTPG